MLFNGAHENATKAGAGRTVRFRMTVVALLVAVLASACSIDTTADAGSGGVGVQTDTGTEQSVGTVVTDGENEDEATEDVFNPITAARASVVRVVTEGTFVEPDGTFRPNTSGSGSGFFISDDGLAVTNNHVVTGAAIVEVYVEGEDRPRNARVLGASECLDLAVIDVDGEGFPALPWTSDAPFVGQPIFALGYPLGDEQFTALEGIVSKEAAAGESDFASVDTAIEHSADTLGGNSGGPVVNEAGEVVAVNYAGNGFGQAFAIRADLAKEAINELMQGNNLDWIGISGVAYQDADVSGVFVRSVESGSPADEVGVQPGDLIVALDGFFLATDGTMADYCDILRTNAPGDAVAIDVFRPSTGELLNGWLNSGTAFGE